MTPSERSDVLVSVYGDVRCAVWHNVSGSVWQMVAGEVAGNVFTSAGRSVSAITQVATERAFTACLTER